VRGSYASTTELRFAALHEMLSFAHRCAKIMRDEECVDNAATPRIMGGYDNLFQQALFPKLRQAI
jgi:hypothetical protein